MLLSLGRRFFLPCGRQNDILVISNVSERPHTITLAWREILQGKAFQNDIALRGRNTWQEILPPCSRQNDISVISNAGERSHTKCSFRRRCFATLSMTDTWQEILPPYGRQNDIVLRFVISYTLVNRNTLLPCKIYH